MTQGKFEDLCKRFAKMDLNNFDTAEDNFLFLYSFMTFLETVEPLIDKYVPKEPKKAKKPKKPAEKYYKFGIDGKIEPLE